VIAKNDSPVIGVVGVCGSGKSTLITGLKLLGINGKHIAQEHSYVQTMWLRLVHPDLLIFLDASYPATVHRRNLNWNEEEYQEQHRRLTHARQHADLYIFTDPLTSAQVIQTVLEFLTTRGFQVKNDQGQNS
jgi:ABC-type dipeptide/oligopeptide/nickel transport system ATPase component